MRGRDFLDAARAVMRSASEPRRRAAVIHAYYALMLECRDALGRWGRVLSPRGNVHADVRLTFTYSMDPEARSIADALDRLVRGRNQASYDLSHAVRFESDRDANACIQLSSESIELLLAIDEDDERRLNFIASLPHRAT